MEDLKWRKGKGGEKFLRGFNYLIERIRCFYGFNFANCGNSDVMRGFNFANYGQIRKIKKKSPKGISHLTSYPTALMWDGNYNPRENEFPTVAINLRNRKSQKVAS